MTLFLFILLIWFWTESAKVYGDVQSDNPQPPSKFQVYFYIPMDFCRNRKNYTNFARWLNKDHPDYSKLAAEGHAFLYNENMANEGKEIHMFYSPGTWPRIVYRTLDEYAQHTDKKYYCGGIPQKCQLSTHVGELRKLFKVKPKTNERSLGIIAVGHWRPIWRQNTRWDKVIYQIESVVHQLQDPKNNNSDMIKAKAQAAFEKSAMEWYKTTIDEANLAKDKVLWGYMGLPSCFNKQSTTGECSIFSKQDNIRLSPIVKASTALYPTGFLEDPKAYANYHLDGELYLKKLLAETFRVAKINPPRRYIVVVIRYKYRNGNNMALNDFIKSLTVPCLEGADAVLIYGDNRDASQCAETWYLYRTLIEVALNSSAMAACRSHWYPWYQKPEHAS